MRAELPNFNGEEPTFNVGDTSESQLCKILNWYSNTLNSEEAKEYLITYLRNQNYDAKSLRQIQSAYTPTTLGWLARIATRCPELPEKYKSHLSETVATILANTLEADEVVIPKYVPDIQKKIEEQVSSYIIMIDEQIDLFIETGKSDFDFLRILQRDNVKAIQTKKILEHYSNGLLKELQETSEKKCAQLIEAYGYLNKRLKPLLEFVKQIVGAATVWEEQVRLASSRKPRKKKVKTAEQLTEKMQYRKECAEYNLVSTEPKKIIGANMLWLFDTKKRTLALYLCDNVHGFSVKGSKLLNFDQKLSVEKKLRKPQETIKQVLEASKPASKKLFSAIKAKEKVATGKIKSDMIILRVL